MAYATGAASANAGTLNGGPVPSDSPMEQKSQKRRRWIAIVLSIGAFFVTLELMNLFVVYRFEKRVAAETNVSYATYANAHGAYSVCFDPTVFSRREAPGNKNLQEFNSKDGAASFTIYTSKLGNWTLPQLQQIDAESYTKSVEDTVIISQGLGPMSYNIEAKRVGEHLVEVAIMDNQTTVNRLRASFDTKSPINYDAQFHRIVRCFKSTRENQ